MLAVSFVRIPIGEPDDSPDQGTGEQITDSTRHVGLVSRRGATPSPRPDWIRTAGISLGTPPWAVHARSNAHRALVMGPRIPGGAAAHDAYAPYNPDFLRNVGDAIDDVMADLNGRPKRPFACHYRRSAARE